MWERKMQVGIKTPKIFVDVRYQREQRVQTVYNQGIIS
jgi:hypothetical protein